MGSPKFPIEVEHQDDETQHTVTLTQGYYMGKYEVTQAQWEYACRAGTTTAYNTGATLTDSTGWNSNNSGNMTHEVGLKSVNAWGLYDMHGNVSEWCWDWYNSNYYSNSPTDDPMGPSSGTYRVARGGYWFSSELRSAFRGNTNPWYRYTVGFRLVRPLGE